MTTELLGIKKTAETLNFRGFLEVVWSDYLFENCGARRAAFKPG